MFHWPTAVANGLCCRPCPPYYSFPLKEADRLLPRHNPGLSCATQTAPERLLGDERWREPVVVRHSRLAFETRDVPMLRLWGVYSWALPITDHPTSSQAAHLFTRMDLAL